MLIFSFDTAIKLQILKSDEKDIINLSSRSFVFVSILFEFEINYSDK